MYKLLACCISKIFIQSCYEKVWLEFIKRKKYYKLFFTCSLLQEIVLPLY
jgi:hypothetical protein